MHTKLNKNILVLTGVIFSLFLGLAFLINQKVCCRMVYEIHNVKDLIDLFPSNIQEIDRKVEMVLDDVREQVKKILNIKNEDRTFENTVKAYDKIGGLIGPVMSSFQAIESLSPNAQMREKAHEAMLKLSDFITDNVGLNVDLYKAFKSYVEGNYKNENLSEERKYYIKESMADFKRSGLDLPKEKLDKVRSLVKELTALSLEFETNIAKDNCKIFVSKNELEGMDKAFIDNLQKDKDGKYILGCDYPTYFAIMENCTVSATRQKLHNAFNNRAYPQNIEVLSKVIAKRDELAKLLNFNSFADLELSNQMAKNPEKVRTFLNNIIDKASKKANKEIQTFTKDLPESVKLTKDGKIYPWDSKFLKTYYKKKYLNLDENKVSEYFPLENTIAQLLNVYEKFLGLKFKEMPVSGFWDKEVKLIEAYDLSGNLLGYLLLDLYPRDNKFSHAANMGIVAAIKNDNAENNISASVVMANFPKPTKTSPSLLKFKDVVTFFHEFGHAIHNLLGRTEFYGTSGTSVKKDFVEMPSQMLEYWLTNKEILKMVSKHYQTGEPLPDDLINTIAKLDKFDSGDSTIRQAYYAFLSLDYYLAGANKDTQAISQELFKKLIKHMVWIPEEHFQASFGHLMGYGAGYYGYLWSKVFARDLFEQIEKYGLLDPEIGQKYIKDVIGQGGSKDPNELLKSFLGREPNEKAFLRDMGFN